MYKKTFTSSNEGEPPIHINLFPTVPKVEIRIGESQPCTLQGEDFGNFIAWMKEQGYHG